MQFVGISGGLFMSMIAFSIVFLVIMGLMLVMMGTKMLAQSIEGTGQKAPATASAPAPSSVAASVATAPQTVAADNDELIAVLAAAVASICGGSARIVSFAPTTGAAGKGNSFWKADGRDQNMEGC